MNKVSLETLVSLAKRRGFVFPASEIYGGVSGFWDYGPYGASLVSNIKQAWWNEFVRRHRNIVGLNTAIIQHSKLWAASGHTDTFHDPLVQCSSCHHLARADHIKNDTCPNCGKKGTLGKPQQFNLMFKTNIGPIDDVSNASYLRPETAGGIFAQYDQVRETARQKVPFGIAQIGKAFRNEISPRDFLFRVREFEQMEIEYFVNPKEAPTELKRWKEGAWKWLLDLGIDKGKLKWHEHGPDERAHYAAQSFDIEYDYPFGNAELWGIANRTDFDLKAHAKASGKDLQYFDQASGKKFYPYVIEPSLGVDRLFLALLDSAYHEEDVKGEKRVVLKLDKRLAPVKVAVLPLSKDKELSPLALEVFDQLKDHFDCEYDENQSIGRRYRRQDEIGTPYCVTVDFDSLKDKAVTIRDRDTMKQDRIKIDQLVTALKEKL